MFINSFFFFSGFFFQAICLSMPVLFFIYLCDVKLLLNDYFRLLLHVRMNIQSPIIIIDIIKIETTIKIHKILSI